MTLESKLDRGLQEPELITRVVTRSLEPVTVNGAAAQQVLQSIGQLNLAAAAGLDGIEGPEYLGRQHVAADDGQIGRRLTDFGFLHHVADTIEPVSSAQVRYRLGVHDAVSGNIFL